MMIITKGEMEEEMKYLHKPEELSL